MNSNACVHSIVLSVEVWKVGQLPLAGVFFVCDTALLIAVTSIAVKIIWDTANVLSVLLENDSGIIISSYQRQKQERTSASNIRLPTNRSHLGMYSPIIIFRLIEQFRDRSYTPIFAFFFFHSFLERMFGRMWLCRESDVGPYFTYSRATVRSSVLNLDDFSNLKRDTQVWFDWRTGCSSNSNSSSTSLFENKKSIMYWYT